MADHRVEADFVRDLVQHFRKQISGLGYTVSDVNEVADLARRYLNVARRRIPQLPRQVEVAPEIACPQDSQRELAMLLDRARKGYDLNPWISKNIGCPDFKDALLNDWGVHHFHLSSSIGADGFADRTRELLFAHVSPSHFRALIVMDHGGFASLRLLEILHRNWPEITEMHRLHGVTGTAHPLTDGDVALLRRGGVQAIVELSDGTVLAPPGGGYTADGTSVEIVRQADQLLAVASELEVALKANPRALVESATRSGIELPLIMRLRLEIHGTSAMAVEEASGMRLSLGEFPVLAL